MGVYKIGDRRQDTKDKREHTGKRKKGEDRNKDNGGHQAGHHPHKLRADLPNCIIEREEAAPFHLIFLCGILSPDRCAS
jgi:hypothetical protein